MYNVHTYHDVLYKIHTDTHNQNQNKQLSEMYYTYDMLSIFFSDNNKFHYNSFNTVTS